MNTPNPENPADALPEDLPTADTPPAEVSDAAPAPAVPEFQPLDLKRRLRELLSVPERDRSDEQWDEIIELEIQLAPGNRISGGEATGNAPRHQGKPGGGGGAAGGAGQQQKKHRPRTKPTRRPRPNNKPGGGGGAPA